MKKTSEFNSSKDDRVNKWKDKKICGQPDMIKSVSQNKNNVSKGDQIQNHIQNLKDKNHEQDKGANNNEQMELPKTIHHQGTNGMNDE